MTISPSGRPGPALESALPSSSKRNDAHSRPITLLCAPFFPRANTPSKPLALSAERVPRMYQPVARRFAVNRQANSRSAAVLARMELVTSHSHNLGIFQYGLHSPTL